MCLRYRRRGGGVDTLLSNTTFSVLTNDFKILIKVATTPLLLPLSNVNNSCLFYINPYIAIHCGVAIKETLPISIFVAVSTVNKVSYKLYRRGLFERQSAMLLGGQASSAVCTKFVETLLTVLRV